jgi:hypothetical protein
MNAAAASKRRGRSSLPTEPEKQFLAVVVEAARLLGWRVYHTYDSRRSAAGFPDLVAVRGPRLVVAELKTAAGKTSADQNEWLAALAAVPGVEVYEWRPDDWNAVAAVFQRA